MRPRASPASQAPITQAQYAIDGNTNGVFEKKSTTHTKNEKNPWWQVDLNTVHDIDSITLWNRQGRGLPERLNGARITILDGKGKPVWTRDFPKATAKERQIDVAEIPSNILRIANIEAAQRNAKQIETLQKYFWKRTKTYSDLQALLLKKQNLLAGIKRITTVPIMSEMAKPRTTKIQIRGNYLDTGETVSAGTPAIFPELRKGADRSRLELAKWLVSRQNPLTSRVVVNRFWEKLFGTGIVLTSEEFGNQGDLPSHPELLDYLAVEFIDSGWDQKALIKKIVMSATYRQSSSVSESKRKLDPANRYLARGPRLRLTAEMVRDQALFAGGLLSSKMYGPPVQPPQPKFGLKAAFSGSVDWNDSRGEDRYRRAVYTEWRRSAPYPSMSTFDKSNLEVCEIKRASTNTPLQALVTLNDPVYVEAAQALARRVAVNPKDRSPEKVAAHAFRLCLIRPPSKPELSRIVKLYAAAKAHFSERPDEARMLGNDPLNPSPADTNFVELAAWTTVANVLLNLDEVFQKP